MFWHAHHGHERLVIALVNQDERIAERALARSA